IEELCSYLGLDFSKRQLAELLDEYRAWGLNAEQGLRLAEIRTKKKRGAGISARMTAVQALERRLADSRWWTWRRLAQELCKCPKPKNGHDSRCWERLRQAVMALEKLLRKHGVYPEKEDDGRKPLKARK